MTLSLKPTLSSCMCKFLDSSDPAADNLFGHFEVIGRLQVNPVLRRLAEGLAEKQGFLRDDRSYPFDNGNSHGRKPNSAITLDENCRKPPKYDICIYNKIVAFKWIRESRIMDA